jgi:hypothetical protein
MLQNNPQNKKKTVFDPPFWEDSFIIRIQVLNYFRLNTLYSFRDKMEKHLKRAEELGIGSGY